MGIFDGIAESLHDQLRGFVPAHVLKHHDGGEDQRAGIDLVLTGVLGSRAMSRLKQRHLMADVGAGSQTEPADQGDGRVGQIVPIKIGQRHHAVFFGPRLYLLKNGICDTILDEDFALRHLTVPFFPQRLFRDEGVAKFSRRDLVAPFAEGALGELHDVALVDQGDGREFLLDRPFAGLADQTLGARLGHGLDTNPAVESDLTAGHLFDEIDDGKGHFAASFEIVTGVDILGVFAKDHELNLVCRLVGAGDTLEIVHRPHAGIEVHPLSEPHID